MPIWGDSAGVCEEFQERCSTVVEGSLALPRLPIMIYQCCCCQYNWACHCTGWCEFVPTWLSTKVQLSDEHPDLLATQNSQGCIRLIDPACVPEPPLEHRLQSPQLSHLLFQIWRTNVLTVQNLCQCSAAVCPVFL